VNIMKTNKARRLSVRVSAEGWEARISNQNAQRTKAEICNISADGAYLITKEKYEVDSRVTLWITSPLISFSVTALVVRKDASGLAVRFLDQSTSTRSSLLSIVTKFLAEKRLKHSLKTEIALCRESQPRLTIDLKQEFFPTTELLDPPPYSQGSSVAKRNSNRTKERCLMLSLAQTESQESLKVFLGSNGKTTVKCPFCGTSHRTEVPKDFHNKLLKGKCNCGESFPLLFDSRKYYRKAVWLPGEYWNSVGEKDLMTVTTLSFSGAGFESGRMYPSVKTGETIRLNFLLKRNDRLWIRSSALVRRVNGNHVGVDFIGMDDYQQKCLGFYLMP
jgi:hypothetical protein